eukprot:7259587-Pyramimonas_sp.AAC.1
MFLDLPIKIGQPDRGLPISGGRKSAGNVGGWAACRGVCRGSLWLARSDLSCGGRSVRVGVVVCDQVAEALRVVVWAWDWEGGRVAWCGGHLLKAKSVEAEAAACALPWLQLPRNSSGDVPDVYGTEVCCFGGKQQI